MPPSYSQAYYENPDIWELAAWQNRAADRVRAIIASEWLPPGVRSVLDVGCGNGVFTNLAGNGKLKVGVDLSRAALENVTAARSQADATWLPFADHSFEACLCMEMLEHLPDPEYRGALDELARISGKIILISVPYNEKLQYNRLICPACLHAFHPYYHLRSYTRHVFPTLFGPNYRLEKLAGIVPTTRKAIPVLWNLVGYYFHRRGRNFPLGVICPHCGYKRDPEIDSIHQVPNTSTLKKSIRRMWPERNSFTWWMALYQKSG